MTANVHSPSFPHGSPAGFDAGCRAAACSGAYLSGITCRDAKRRYVGDWTFRRRVDAGMTPRDIMQLEAAEVEAEKRVATLERILAAEIKEAERIRYTRDDLIGAVMVRSEIHGWRKVRRVNTKSVSVDSGYSWADYIAIEKVTGVRK